MARDQRSVAVEQGKDLVLAVRHPGVQGLEGAGTQGGDDDPFEARVAADTLRHRDEPARARRAAQHGCRHGSLQRGLVAVGAEVVAIRE